jgi:Leucine-rich repeat (LRR) protein
MRLFTSNMLNFEKHHAGLKVLSSKLKKLENLDLSGNQCNDSIFSSLSGFSSLKYLNLSRNQLTGSSTGINSKLHSLKKIEDLIYIYLVINDSINFISKDLYL